MRIPIVFRGSGPLASPLLWSRESGWAPSPNCGASACGWASWVACAAGAVPAWCCAADPDGATSRSEDTGDGEGVLRGRVRDDEMESLRLPTCTLEGEMEREWRRTLSMLGAASGSTAEA